MTHHVDELDTTVVKIHKREVAKDKFRDHGGSDDIMEGTYGLKLKKILLMKADKTDLEKLYDVKSDKKESEFQ